MKSFVFSMVCLLISSVLLCACTVKPQKSTINYQRRLKKYIQTENLNQYQTIDLSEGPRLKYDANLGPQDVSFDFKIKNPY